MSCGCNNNGYGGYGSVCPDIPYPSISAESVPSAINNLTYSLYGLVTKSVVNGQIVWTTPCDGTYPNFTGTINGLTRNAGEGLLCYILRGMNTLVTATPTFTSVTAGNYIANQALLLPSNIGAYSYGTLSYNDTNLVASYQSSVNSYLQTIFQNTSNGYLASTDIVISNDLGTSTGYYGNIGMNSSGFGSFTGVGSISGTTLTITSVVSGGISVGTYIYVPSTYYIVTALVTGTGGVGTYTLNTSGSAGAGTTITGSAYQGTTPSQSNFNLPNATYISSTNSDLAIGTTTSNAIHFLINKGSASATIGSTQTATDALTIGTDNSSTFYGNVILKNTLTGSNGVGVSGYILTSGGTTASPSWTAPTAFTAGTATNIAGGTAGSVPYQTGVGATSQLSIGTAGQILVVNSGATAPVWGTDHSGITTSVSSANAGFVGEVIQLTLVGSGTMSSGTTGTLFSSTSLTAGDWEIYGTASVTASGLSVAGNTSILIGLTSTGTTTSPVAGKRFAFPIISSLTATSFSFEQALPPIQYLQTSANATIYLQYTMPVFTLGSATANANIWARRMR